MAWTADILAKSLAKYKHLLISSGDLIQQLSGIRLRENDVFVHFDLRDFFMTGRAKWLTHHSALIVPLKFRKVLRTVLFFLLTF